MAQQPPDLNRLMQEAQKMHTRMEQAQKELSELEVEGSAGGGLVKVMMNGRNDVKKVLIDPDVLDEGDIKMLEDLVAAAINDAVRKVEKASRAKMAGLTAGLDIPTDFGGGSDGKS